MGKKSYVPLVRHTSRRYPYARQNRRTIKNDLNAEIQFLENKYLVIKDFLAGKDYDISVIAETLQEFKVV